MKSAKQTTFQGMNFSNAKRVVEYEFADSLIKIEKNNQTQTYEVHILDKIEKKVVDKFKAYWQNNFKIKVYTLKYEL